MHSTLLRLLFSINLIYGLFRGRSHSTKSNFNFCAWWCLLLNARMHATPVDCFQQAHIFIILFKTYCDINVPIQYLIYQLFIHSQITYDFFFACISLIKDQDDKIAVCTWSLMCLKQKSSSKKILSNFFVGYKINRILFFLSSNVCFDRSIFNFH